MAVDIKLEVAAPTMQKALGSIPSTSESKPTTKPVFVDQLNALKVKGLQYIMLALQGRGGQTVQCLGATAGPSQGVLVFTWWSLLRRTILRDREPGAALLPGASVLLR
jgi:hypothetical protein